MKSIVWFVIGAFIFISQALGCATPASYKVSESSDPIRVQITESFGWSHKDAGVIAFRASEAPAGGSDDMALEMILLAELVNTEKRDDLVKAWDRLWRNHEQIKRLLLEKEYRQDYPHSTAMIYYLLSAMPDPTWQRLSAQRLYQESLCQVRPEKLSGYALHYYCQGLLLNGKYQQAMPYIQRLEQFTTPKIYAQDLTWVVRSAIENQQFDMAERYFAQLMAYAGHLKDDSVHDECRKASVLIMAAEPETILQASRQAVAQYYPKLFAEHQPAALGQAHGQTLLRTQYPQATVVEVKVIQAGRDRVYVDPQLADISANLKTNLRFSSFRQISCDEIHLIPSVPFTMKLVGNMTLRLHLESVKASRARIGLQIKEFDKSLFATTVDSVDQGTSIIGGPVTDNGMVVVWLLTKLQAS